MSPHATAARVVTLGLDTWQVSLDIAETMAASQAVIATRVAMFAGIDRPGRWPIAEFNRLVPEKAVAFGKASAGAARALRLGGAHQGVDLLDWWETAIHATAAWWAPIRAQVVANARRLG